MWEARGNKKAAATQLTQFLDPKGQPYGALLYLSQVILIQRNVAVFIAESIPTQFTMSFSKSKRHKLDNVHLPSVRKTALHLSFVFFRSTCACVDFSKLSLPHNTLPKPRLCRNNSAAQMAHGPQINMSRPLAAHSFHQRFS